MRRNVRRLTREVHGGAKPAATPAAAATVAPTPPAQSPTPATTAASTFSDGKPVHAPLPSIAEDEPVLPMSTAAAVTAGMAAGGGGGGAEDVKDKVVGAVERDAPSKSVVPREKGTGARKKGRPRKATGLAGEILLVYLGKKNLCAGLIYIYNKSSVE